MTFRRALIAFGLLTLAASAHAQVVPQPGPPTNIACAYNTTPVTLQDGQAGWIQCNNQGFVIVTGTVTAFFSGTGANNADNVAAVTTGLMPSVAYNYVWDGATWDRLYGDSTNGAFVQIKSAIALAVTFPTTPTIAAGNGVIPATSSESGAAATVTSTAVLASNLVVKASAGNLYSFEVAADSTLSAAAWWIMIFDATSLPGNGAVTPAKCYAMPLGATSFSAGFNFPVRHATGITIGVSTTGCFTITASVHAFISGDFK